MKRLVLCLTITGLASGCVSSNFTNAVAGFGTLTETAVAQQNEGLSAIVADEEERIALARAEQRLDFRLSPNCRPDAMAQSPRPCELVRQDGNSIEKAPKFKHIFALGKALETYADSLATLAEDTSADREAFKESLSEAGSELAGLQSAVLKALQIETELVSSGQIDAATAIAGDIGALYLQKKRVDALKSLIIEGDATIQSATTILDRVYRFERLYGDTVWFAGLTQRQDEASRIMADSNSTVAQRRAAQEALFEAVDKTNRLSRGRDRFAAIGKAHGDLATAASRGAGKEELLAAARSILKVAETIETELPALKDETAEGGE